MKVLEEQATEELERLLASALDPTLGWGSARRRSARKGSVPLKTVAKEAALKALKAVGGRVLLVSDGEFPPKLRDLPQGPVALFIKGTIPQGPMLAIVGSRACSVEGARLSFELAYAAAEAGWVVVSGGALGVDTAAHEGALAASGITVAILGSGLDRPYPVRNAALFDRITQLGAVITPYPPGTPPFRQNFPRRNRLVAALADRVVVVEARARSGALSTARAALVARKGVAAVPGTPGCDSLLYAGAVSLRQPSDLLCWLEDRPFIPQGTEAPTPEAEAVLHVLGTTPLPLEDVADRAGLSPQETHAALLMLELWGLAFEAQGRYVRLPDASCGVGHSHQPENTRES